jgi:hypothetical protein
VKLEEEKHKLEVIRRRGSFRFGQASKGEKSSTLLLSELLTREELKKLEHVLPSYSVPKSLKIFNVSQLPASLLCPPSYKDLLNFEINNWL